MRLVLQSRSFNSVSSAGSLSRHGIQKLPLGAAPTAQFGRLFTTRGSLAAWNRNTKTAPRSKASKPNSDPTSEHSNSESGTPGAAASWNKPKFKACERQSEPVSEHTNEPISETVITPTNEMTSEPVRNIMIDTANRNAGDQETAAFDSRISDLVTIRGRKPKDADTVRKEFYAILETAQPDQVMAAMLNYDCEELVATMPQSSFIEALHLLSPAHFVEPFKEIYRPLHPYTVQIKRFKAQHTLFDDFVRNLSAIVRIRRSRGQALGLAEYTHLLDCARSLGDALMADHIWNSMRMDDISPNLECYNHYMEAKVWNSAYTGKEKYRLRITPFSYRRRKFGDLGWEGYGTAGRSVRTEVQEIFDEMTASGIDGDEASIVNLFMAAARVGDNETMECILQTIWNIDVDALRKGRHVEVTEYDRSSPFYPSARLLRAVAHSFSAANDIESAVRIIELVSRSYDVEVPESIWAELFEWAFVLSRRKYGPDAERKSKGLINTSLLENLFETMTKEPYNIEPSAEMHSKLAKTAWVFHRLNDFLYHMRAAYKVLDETRRKRIAAREIVESYLRYPRSNDGEMDPQILWSRGFADAVHTYDVLRLLVMQQTRIIERLANLLIHRGDWLGRSFDVWERRLTVKMTTELAAAPVLSTPDDRILEETDPVVPQTNRILSEEELAITYDIERTLKEIRQARYKRIALQFPDEMLPDAPRVFQLLSRGLEARDIVDGGSKANTETEPTDGLVDSASRLDLKDADEWSPKLYILADTSYGTCCVDEVAAEHVDADVVVHYGRSCLSPTARLPVIYVFTHKELPLDPVLKAFKETYPDPETKVILAADVTYSDHIPEVYSRLVQEGYSSLFATALVHDPSSVIPNRTVPDSVKEAPESLGNWQLFHISEPPTALLLTLASRVAAIHIYPTDGPAGTDVKPLPASTAMVLRRRYAILTRLSTVPIFGILVNTLSVKNYLHIVDHVRDKIAAAGKKSYMFVVGKLNAAKVANFSEIGGWVVIGCWESSLVDSKDFWKPVITPFELEVALKGDEERVWTGAWQSDFQSILDQPPPSSNSPGNSQEANEGPEFGDHARDEDEDAMSEPESAPPEFDLRTGRYVSYSRPMRDSAPRVSASQGATAAISAQTGAADGPSAARALARRAKGDLAMVGNTFSPGAEFLRSQRTWTGLGSDFNSAANVEYDDEENDSTLVVQGRKGIARGYTVGDSIDRH